MCDYLNSIQRLRREDVVDCVDEKKQRIREEEEESDCKWTHRMQTVHGRIVQGSDRLDVG